MTTGAGKAEDYAWQKEYAPRISRPYFFLVAALYVVWMSFLAVIAVNRWFGSLQ